jgi:U3 small nucleolar RNA-associated protein 3
MARTRRRQSRGSAKKKRGFSAEEGDDQVLGKLGLGDDNEEEEIALELDSSDDDAAAGGLGLLADDMEEEKGWGKDKRAFYDGDDYEEDLDDDLGVRAEEEEAISLQHQEAEELDEGDFDKDIGVVQSSKKKTKKTKTPKKSMEKRGADTVEDGEDAQFEPEEDAALMKELLERLQEVRKHLAPLMENITGPSATQTMKNLEEMQKGSENPGSIDRGVSYLEMKFQLMLVYCMNLAYFLFRRSKGLAAKSHPVVENLLRARTYFERLRPLDKRMRYQIDALLSSLPGKDGKAGSDATPSVDRSAELRSFKPHADDFVSGEDAGEGKEGEEGGELVRAEKMRMEAVDLDDPKSQKRRDKSVARAQSAVRRSRLIQEMEEEFSEKPIEVESIGATRLGGEDESEEEQEKFEEEHLTRLRVNRETKKRRAHRERERMKSSLDDGLMEDWEDFVDLSKRIDRGVHSLQRGKTVESVGVGDVRGTEGLSDGGGSGEESENMSEDEMYASAQREKKVLKKRKLAQEHSSRELSMHSQDDDFAPVKSSGRRKATKEMIQNRGLVAYRKKDDRNPRVKMRRKYDKGLQRRKGQVAPMRERSTHYAGEATGIKKKVTKSVRFAK